MALEVRAVKKKRGPHGILSLISVLGFLYRRGLRNSCLRLVSGTIYRLGTFGINKFSLLISPLQFSCISCFLRPPLIVSFVFFSLTRGLLAVFPGTGCRSAASATNKPYVSARHQNEQNFDWWSFEKSFTIKIQKKKKSWLKILQLHKIFAIAWSSEKLVVAEHRGRRTKARLLNRIG